MSRDEIARRMRASISELERTWGPYRQSRCNVRRAVFVKTRNDHVYPAYATTIRDQRRALECYADWCGSMYTNYSYWIDYVECLVNCHEFTDKASIELKEWAFGTLCRMAIDRERAAYDPILNWSL